MPPGQQQSGQDPDNSLTPLWLTLGAFVLGGFIWFFFKTYIIAFVMIIRGLEIDLLDLLLPQSWSANMDQARAAISAASSSGYQSVTFSQLYDVSELVGSYLRFPFAIILVILALILYFKKATSRFRHVYDMQTLLNEEYINWPQVVPVVKLDLINTDIDKGPWAMADSPLMFAKKNRLLIIESFLPKAAMLKNKAINIASIKRDEARSIFAMQLDVYWTGPEALPIATRALYAVFAARINSDRAAAEKILNQISKSAMTGKLDFSHVDEVVKKYQDSKIVKQISQQHAFVDTLMASMLEHARDDGVLASADFLWLKPINRKLWFLLNSIGRQTPFTEVSGIFAHWLAEKELGRKITLPMIEEAVNGLEKAIKEIIVKPEESEVADGNA
ncbi:MAG: type IVB secretion system coupling complex protein DotM/IcmP [Pseudomonadota bacterium]